MLRGNPALVHTEFADMVVTEATSEAEAVVKSLAPKFAFI